MEGNPICKQIPWEEDAAKVAAWEAGKTGFPWLVTTLSVVSLEAFPLHTAMHLVVYFICMTLLGCYNAATILPEDMCF